MMILYYMVFNQQEHHSLNTTCPLQYLSIHVQLSVAGQSSYSLTYCLLVPVHWHHVEAEVELING